MHYRTSVRRNNADSCCCAGTIKILSCIKFWFYQHKNKHIALSYSQLRFPQSSRIRFVLSAIVRTYLLFPYFYIFKFIFYAYYHANKRGNTILFKS